MEQGLDVLVLIVAAGALLFSGIHHFQRAMRFDAPSGIKELSEHQRSPVLYLRSFDDNPKVARRVGIAGFKLSNEEEDLAEIVSTLGPSWQLAGPEKSFHIRAPRVCTLARATGTSAFGNCCPSPGS